MTLEKGTLQISAVDASALGLTPLPPVAPSPSTPAPEIAPAPLPQQPEAAAPMTPSPPLATPVRKTMDVIDFLVDWRGFIGQTVTVTGCSLQQAGDKVVVCSAGSQGMFFIDGNTLSREDLRRALRKCAGFEKGDECRVDVTGNVVGGAFGAELKNAAMKWAAMAAAPQSPPLASPSPQAQGTPPPVHENQSSAVDAKERIRSEITAYAATKGETSQEFSQRIGNSLEEIVAFASAVERSGGTSLGAIKSLDGFSEALKDPDKRKLVRCLGVRLTENPHELMPSESECAALQQRFGAPP
jgi:hypothetical protein